MECNQTKLCYWCKLKDTCKLERMIRVIERDEACYLYNVQLPKTTEDE